MNTAPTTAPPSGALGETAAFPPYLMYDVTNLCNARCPFCPQSTLVREADFEGRHLSWDDFEKTIREAAGKGVELVRFTGDGEPLLHPRMADMVALAKDLEFPIVNLTTNGSLLSGKRLAQLLANPPHVFDISLDSATPEVFAQQRVGLNFEQTMENVHHLLQARDGKRTKVIVSMIAHPGFEQEVEKFTAYWRGRADEVAIRDPHTNLGMSGTRDVGGLERWPCPHLWQRLVVDFRGHIRFCPIDWRDQSFLGKVADMTLDQAWNSAQMRTLRRRHMDADYGGCGVCEKCVDWSSTRWGHTWLDLATATAAS